MTDDFDDLDRALFGMPLETPPAGMREAILRATVYAENASALAFTRFEIMGIGAALALGAWLVVFAFANRGFAEVFAADFSALAHGLGEPTALAWFAAGGAVAMLATLANFSFGNLSLVRLPLRNGRP